MKANLKNSVFLILCPLILCSSSLLAADYYVSPSGSDITGNGTIGSPWGTIQFALGSAFPGDILYLRGGVYNEQLLSVRSGTPGAYITITTFNNEDAFIDGTGVVTGNNGSLISHSYLKMNGFTIRNWLHNGMELFNCEFVELRNLKVTGVTGGIHFTGTVHDFVVDSCIMYDYYGGSGGFGFDATPEGATDSIYNGVISNCKAYITAGAFDNCDGFGLGHDGVRDIHIQNCEAYGVGDAFDISGANILLENCSAHGSSFGGGYKLWRDSVTLVNCIGYDNITNVELDFDSSVIKGVKARLINCTFFGAHEDGANIFIELSAQGSKLEMYNCILAGGNNTGLNFGGDNLGRYSISGYTGDYNVFHNNDPGRMVVTSDPEFSLTQIQNGEWTALSGQDSHSIVVFNSTTLFQDTLGVSPDLHLRNGSLAIDHGINLPDAPSVDFDNCPRTVGPIDIGAYEFGACGPSGISEKYLGSSDSYRLDQNYPNPFNPVTTISFSLPRSTFTTLKIFDALGREIATLISDELSPGKYSTEWTARDVASGVYCYRLQAGNFVETKKLVVLR